MWALMAVTNLDAPVRDHIYMFDSRALTKNKDEGSYIQHIRRVLKPPFWVDPGLELEIAIVILQIREWADLISLQW